MYWIDTHCHLDLILERSRTTSLPEIIAQAKQAGVVQLISIATSLENYQQVSALTYALPGIRLSCGVHPLCLPKEACTTEALFIAAGDPRVVAIGETGLDYTRAGISPQRQQEAFQMHISVALQLRKPLVVHTRGAMRDTLGHLRHYGEDRLTGVIHCFSEDVESARTALALGFFISLSGILTFRSSERLREVARYVPLDRILLETDAPYLAPVPYRGKTNQPAYLVETAKQLAHIQRVPLEQVAQQTVRNSQTLFALPPLSGISLR